MFWASEENNQKILDFCDKEGFIDDNLHGLLKGVIMAGDLRLVRKFICREKVSPSLINAVLPSAAEHYEIMTLLLDHPKLKKALRNDYDYGYCSGVWGALECAAFEGTKKMVELILNHEKASSLLEKRDLERALEKARNGLNVKREYPDVYSDVYSTEAKHAEIIKMLQKFKREKFGKSFCSIM